MMQEPWINGATIGIRPSKSAPCSPIKPILRTRSDSFHVAHKVPVGDTPYVKAKRVQLVEKDPDRAIALFWAAINAGDRVDSALKDMAIVMKQQNRTEEAIEAIKSLRNRCSDQAQESLDNILLDLYKRCGRLDDQIVLLKHKLHLIQQGMVFNGKRTKTARSQGRKFQVSVEQEATRLLGNLGWALMQQENYLEAESAYRRALLIGPDNNKMCNLGICLMKQGRVLEAKETLKKVRPATADGPRGVDSHLKAFERAQEMLCDLESKVMMNSNRERLDQNWLFDAFLGSSSVWQPQPCIDFLKPQEVFADENVVDMNRISRSTKPEPCVDFLKPQEVFADENVVDMNRISRSTKPELLPLNNSLNIAAPPFYSKLTKLPNQTHQFHDPLSNLKRTRSNNAMETKPMMVTEQQQLDGPRDRRKSVSLEEESKWAELLPDNNEFNESIVAAVLAPVLHAAEATESKGIVSPLCERKIGKRLRVFQDITVSLSPKA